MYELPLCTDAFYASGADKRRANVFTLLLKTLCKSVSASVLSPSATSSGSVSSASKRCAALIENGLYCLFGGCEYKTRLLQLIAALKNNPCLSQRLLAETSPASEAFLRAEETSSLPLTPSGFVTMPLDLLLTPEQSTLRNERLKWLLEVHINYLYRSDRCSVHC